MSYLKEKRAAEKQKEILTCFAVGVGHRESYPPNARNFFIGLRNISPACFRYVRHEFSDRIPTLGTIKAWLSNSDINAKPGIQQQSLEMLKLKLAENDRKLVGSLSFDEMNIYKMVQCVSGKMIGYEHYPGIDRREAMIATQMLAFLFNAINDDVQIPVAYYFLAASESEDKSKKRTIIQGVINAILECGVELTNITFDGHRSNPKICKDLGSDLNVFSSTFKPSFMVGEHQVRDIFDPSHMQKLVRSTLAANKELYDSNNQPIKWEYFKRLVRFKEQRNMGSIIKIGHTHIEYGSKPMKVKLAIELLSNTNATLMENFMNQGYREFEGAQPTATFTRMFDKLFDVFNSTANSDNKIPLKRPMTVENAPEIIELFENATEYIKGLQIRNAARKLVPLCKSSFNTAFVGYIANMKNLLDIFNELVIEKPILQSIRTHKLSQDHLEVLFGKIRAFCGSGNNPTCVQVNSAMNKLLANTAIQYSAGGNCTILEEVQVYNPFSNISTISSRWPQSVKNSQVYFTSEQIDDVLRELSEIQESSSNNQLADHSDLNTAHIAALIEQKIETSKEFQTGCEECQSIFTMNEKIPDAFMTSIDSRNPCRSTYDIGKAAEHVLKIELLKGQFEPALIYQTIYSSLNIESLYQDSSCENHPDHISQIIEPILQKFIRIKCNYLAKKMSFEVRDKTVRQNLRHVNIFYNQ